MDEDQGAFEGYRAEDMAKRLEERRKQLLVHPALCEVVLKDMIDVTYKSAVDFTIQMGDPKYPGSEPENYPINCGALTSPGMKIKQPSQSGGKDPFDPEDGPKPANPVPSDAPQYLDAVLVKGIVNGERDKKRKKKPGFLKEYGAETAGVLALAAVGGMLYRRKGIQTRMKRSAKIALGVTAGVVVVGGVAYAVTRPKKKNGKKNGKNGNGNGKVPTFKVARITIPIWTENSRARAEEAAKVEADAMGNPEWDNATNLELARAVAARMYPKAKLTKEDGWPKTIKQSGQWIEEAGKTKPEWQGALAWRHIWFIAGAELGYVPVT